MATRFMFLTAARGSSGGLGAYMITGEDYGGSSTGSRTED